MEVSCGNMVTTEAQVPFWAGPGFEWMMGARGGRRDHAKVADTSPHVISSALNTSKAL